MKTWLLAPLLLLALAACAPASRPPDDSFAYVRRIHAQQAATDLRTHRILDHYRRENDAFSRAHRCTFQQSHLPCSSH